MLGYGACSWLVYVQIKSRLDHQLSLSRKMGLIEAIQEMTMQETDLR
jgi:hypothetical protein